MGGVEVGDDSALVAQLRAAEPAAFRALYAAYAQPTFRFLCRLSGRRAWAEDLHQEAWLRIARGAPKLALDTRVAPWVYAISRNVYRTARRRATVTALLRAEWLVRTRPEAEVTADDPGMRDLERALRQLSEGHREILLLVGVEGLDDRQAAEALGLQHAAARQRLSRARAALSAALAAQSRMPETDVEDCAEKEPT